MSAILYILILIEMKSATSGPAMAVARPAQHMLRRGCAGSPRRAGRPVFSVSFRMGLGARLVRRTRARTTLIVPAGQCCLVPRVRRWCPDRGTAQGAVCGYQIGFATFPMVANACLVRRVGRHSGPQSRQLEWTAFETVTRLPYRGGGL